MISLSTNQMPGFLLFTNHRTDTWYPGQEMFVTALWPVLTLQGSAIQILHSDIICALHNDPAWQTITGPLSSGSWGIWCHTGDHWPPSCAGRGEVNKVWVDQNHWTYFTKNVIRLSFCHDKCQCFICPALRSRYLCSNPAQNHPLQRTSEQPMSHCVESKKWIEKGGGRFSDSVNSFLAFSIQGFRDQRFGDTGDADNSLAPYKSPNKFTLT